MAAIERGYKDWNVTSQVEKIYSIAEEIKNVYKVDHIMTANTFKDLEKGFASSHLFWTDKDFYYSEEITHEDSYVPFFLDDDKKVAFRDRHKRTERGIKYPTLLTPDDLAKPGDVLAPKKQSFVNLTQDESAPIPDWHTFNSVDWQKFSLADRFLDADSYFQMVNMVYGAMREGNMWIEKAIVDYILASIVQLWSYPSGHALFRLFVKDDTYVPDEADSKDARAFFLKSGEVRKRLEEIGKYVRQYYKARVPYLTNVSAHEVIGTSVSKTVPKWNAMLVDRSDETKALEAVRGWFFEKKNEKYVDVGYNLRRVSLYALYSAINSTLNRATTRDYRNWCGHEFGKDVKNSEGYLLRSKPSNLMVIMNEHDLEDLFMVKGSEVQGPFTDSESIKYGLNRWESKGVTFHGCKFIIPSMCIIIDKIAFRVVQYFNETYEHFDPTKLVDIRINHMFKKILLYRKVVCNVLELAEGQKYALPVGWASQHLPFLRDQS